MLSKLKELLITWLTHEAPYEGMPLCDFERIRYEVRPCDVLLIEGRSRVSEVIKQVTQSPWTHSCLYIGRLHDIDDLDLRQLVAEHFQGEPNEQLVIEGFLGKGTIVTRLDCYRNDHIRICRPRDLARDDAQKVIQFATQKLGTDYDVRQIFDLMRFMMPWSFLPRRWRSTLFESTHNSTARTVCSSMIAEGFSKVNFPILPTIRKHEETGIELIKNNPRLITPKDFDYSPYFDIIKYPFLVFGERGFYHDLPWRQELKPIPNEEEVASETKDKADNPDQDSSSLSKPAAFLKSNYPKIKLLSKVILQKAKALPNHKTDKSL